MTVRKRRTNAEQAVLDAIPEYRDAVAIGEAKRLLKEKAAGGRERRLMAFLFHHDFTPTELAHLFAVTPTTVEHHLAEWKRLAGLTDPSLGIRARRERDTREDRIGPTIASPQVSVIDQRDTPGGRASGAGHSGAVPTDTE